MPPQTYLGRCHRPSVVSHHHSSPVILPDLPVGYQSHERHYMLGWPASEEWLAQYALQCDPDLITRCPDKDSLIFMGMHLINRNGYEHCQPEMAVLPEDAPIPKIWMKRRQRRFSASHVPVGSIGPIRDLYTPSSII
ncbi:hypothetical protein OBBRIDRAFT_794497 [Obba rivulosa]|uniref:Uncharacterized protein n=1 Tax=Obba rivulosa TaxID=1052685 RepID=A0A8E2AZ27_9APHY|nr:hypothetical protein OBBRIDRAFT_794497 [Obba rivulosa]